MCWMKVRVGDASSELVHTNFAATISNARTREPLPESPTKTFPPSPFLKSLERGSHHLRRGRVTSEQIRSNAGAACETQSYAI